ncbi:Signal transduction histidine kinase [Halovenus aranensis]|uniref:Signal transduction histidine kinase n=1 Tax=Halovenus aranensis TaxID=890420 RepID=A0A1G8XGD3_9EURY|nr:hybrid sensor histidine kinase/response regulator [Halovenus aranensis]SDJ88800.1 Signal transduction histidine kinase [Halovenus aranensis]
MTDDTETLEVLLIEDNPGDARLIEHHLRGESAQAFAEAVELTHVESLEAGLEALDEGTYSLLFLDLGLPESSGIETLERVDDAVDATPIVVLTGLDDTETALAAIQHGAQDYLPKDEVDSRRLWRSLRYAVERHRQEQALRRRTEQLEFFSGILRHDVNNGIDVIGRNASLLEAELTGEHADRADTILDWSDNIADLTAKVQGMIQGITRGEQRDLESVDISGVIADQVDTVEGMDEGVTIDTSVPFGLLVQADEMLTEVIHNLLTNAVEHNDADEPRVSVEVTADGGTVRVDIRDNGPGLPETERDYLCGRDQQTEESSGFGLHFVRTMVSGYGGSISVADNDPRGTVITLELLEA